MIWWHEKVMRHQVRRVKMLAVPEDDSRREHVVKETLVKCSCGKVWAR